MVKVIYITEINRKYIRIKDGDYQYNIGELLLQPGLTYIIHREHMMFYPLITIECLSGFSKINVSQNNELIKQLYCNSINDVIEFILEIDITTYLNIH